MGCLHPNAIPNPQNIGVGPLATGFIPVRQFLFIVAQRRRIACAEKTKMTAKEEATDITRKFIGLEEHITALKSALTQKFGWTPQQMANLDAVAFRLESQARLEEPSPTRFDQCESAIAAAKDDVFLIPILYEKLGILGKMAA